MIKLITGKPRSGKSYYAVKCLRDQYCYKDKDGLWQVKSKYFIITNIDGLVISGENCKSLKELFRKKGKSFTEFFNYEYQKEISAKVGKDIIYIIDECQQYINPYFRDAETILYFDMHGHLGHTVYLITQDRIKITKQIMTLVEREIRFVQRSLLLTSRNFTYKELVAGDIVGRRTIPVDKTVFELYISQFAEETEKPKNTFVKYIVMMFLALLISGYMLVSRLLPQKKEAHAEPVDQAETTITTKNSKALKKRNHVYTERAKHHESQLIWVQVSYTKLGDGYHLIENPITKAFVPANVYPHNIMSSGKLRLYAQVDKNDMPSETSRYENGSEKIAR